MVRARVRVAQVIAVLLMLLGGVVGLYDLPDEWRGAHTLAQRSVSAAVGLYGLFGVLGAIGLAMRKRWSFPCAVGWAAASTYAGGTAVLSYTPDSPAAGWITAYLGAGVVCALVVWLTRYSVRAT